MKTNITGGLIGLIILLNSFPESLKAQNIIGSWQLVKQTNCISDEIEAESDDEAELVAEMKSMSGPAAKVVQFKKKGMGEESTRILNRKRSASPRNFLYRFDGETLMILDKRSQTLTHTYSVERFSGDSLIVSNANRPCETRIFLKIKDGKSN
ncbi:MAG TPA: hypothetical protein VD927_08630 [Chryseosolibacter sp.]|nr:hypothetical protein [Chryseosolibacter sp.]